VEILKKKWPSRRIFSDGGKRAIATLESHYLDGHCMVFILPDEIIDCSSLTILGFFSGAEGCR
jgi:hypothetical protein